MLVAGLEPLRNSETRIERSFEQSLIIFAYILHTNSLFGTLSVFRGYAHKIVPFS